MPYFQGEPGLLHGEVRQGLPGVQGGVPHLQLVGELSLEGSATWDWQQEKTVKIESDSEQKTSTIAPARVTVLFFLTPRIFDDGPIFSDSSIFDGQ